MIDKDGFRANVGIILCNRDQKLFWGHRIGHLDSWQFPQGGIDDNETPEEAMFRELGEEVGLSTKHIKILGRTEDWLRYRLPQKLIRRNNVQRCIGQKQIWFLLELIADEEVLNLENSETPEFDRWRWIDYWQPADEVIHFKRNVYNAALIELAPLLFGNTIPLRKKPYRDSKPKGRSLYRMGLLSASKRKKNHQSKEHLMHQESTRHNDPPIH